MSDLCCIFWMASQFPQQINPKKSVDTANSSTSANTINTKSNLLKPTCKFALNHLEFLIRILSSFSLILMIFLLS